MGSQASRLRSEPKQGSSTQTGATRQQPVANGNCAEFSPPRTCFDLFRLGHRASRDAACLGSRPGETVAYSWRSYSETLASSLAVGAFLTERVGLRRGSMVGTLSVNCELLAVLELACYAYGFVLVPLYDTLGIEACGHILRETGLRVLFCRDASAKQLAALAQMLPEDDDAANESSPLHLLAATMSESGQEEDDSWPESLRGRVRLHRFEEATRTAPKAEWPQPEPEDLAVICYTSGTTGTPKGVMLTHSNLVTGVQLMSKTIGEDRFGHPTQLTPQDVYFSYLPMAHILERMCQLFCFRHGLRLGFYRGDRSRLMDDMRACAPTFIAAVPRVLSRLRDAAVAAAAGSRLKSGALQLALKAKTRRLTRRRSFGGATVWDRLVFARVRAALGGRVRFVAVGGAPVSAEALQFARVALACPVVQGFGQTETCGVALCQRPGDPSADSTGQPVAGIEVKLADVPDMPGCCRADRDGRGEVCVRGPTCFRGYYKQPDKTAETLDSEGWVHTGDIGELLPDGSYRIVDRLKHLFKLSQGEYVAPEKVELAYCLSPYAEQVFVDGSSEKSCLLAVVVPSREAACRWLAERGGGGHGGGGGSVEQACRSAEFKAEVAKSLAAAAKAKGLRGFEQARDLLLHPEAFTPESGLVTPTLKFRRPQLRCRFEVDFARMYAALEET